MWDAVRGMGHRLNVIDHVRETPGEELTLFGGQNHARHSRSRTNALFFLFSYFSVFLLWLHRSTSPPCLNEILALALLAGQRQKRCAPGLSENGLDLFWRNQSELSAAATSCYGGEYSRRVIINLTESFA